MKSHHNGTNGSRPNLGDSKPSNDLASLSRVNSYGRRMRRTTKGGVANSNDNTQQRAVSHVDFHALGLRPHECRLTVIRRAAARTTRTLATRQLKSPSPRTELQLWRVATSAYRLMDPRKRADSHQRAYVGRIMPNALTSAGHTRFAAGVFNEQQPGEDPWANTIDDSDELPFIDFDEPLISLAHGMELDNDLERTLNSNDILERGVLHRVYLRAKTTLSRRKLSIASAAAAIFFVAAVARYSIDHKVAELPATIAAVDKSLSRPNSESVDEPRVSDADKPLVAAAGSDDVFMDALRSTASIEPRETSPTLYSSVPEPAITSIPMMDIAVEVMPESMSAPRAADLTEARVASVPSIPVVREIIASAFAKDKRTYLDDPFADPTMINTPVLFLESTNRKPIPDNAVCAKYEQQLIKMIEPLQRPLPIEQVDGVLKSLSDFVNASDSESPEHWSARQLAARTTWLTGEVEQVQLVLLPLAASFDVGIDQLTAESFIGAVAFREDASTHLHRTQQGFRLYDHLLRSEQFDLANRVDHEIEKSVDFIDNDLQRNTLKSFRLATEQMTRLKTNASVVINQPISELAANSMAPSSVKPSQSGVAGRYLCLMQRRWDIGLAWLAAGSDTRLAPLAKQELLLDAASTVEERIQVAQRWLAASARDDDRTYDSMLRHSLDLFRSALESADGIQKLEVERSIAEIESKLPEYLKKPVQVSVPVASGLPEIDRELQPTSDSVQESPPDSSETLPTMYPAPAEETLSPEFQTPRLQEPEQRDDTSPDRRRGISMRLGRDKANTNRESFGASAAFDLQPLLGRIQRRHRDAF